MEVNEKQGYLRVHLDNTEAVCRLHFLRKLRFFNVCVCAAYVLLVCCRESYLFCRQLLGQQHQNWGL